MLEHHSRVWTGGAVRTWTGGGAADAWTGGGEALADGETIFVGLVRDLSERNAAELALRERESRLRSILDTIPDGIIVIDERGTVQSFSHAAERLVGFIVKTLAQDYLFAIYTLNYLAPGYY